MQNSSRKNIAGRSKMEDPSISLITSNDAICGTSMPVSIGGARGSPGKRMVLPKTEPPALSLTETVSVSAPLISQAQLQPQVQQPIKPTDEPLLIANPQRFVLFPVEHPDVMAMAKKAIAVFWTPEEIDLTKDIRDWEKLDANTQHFIKHVLGFFAASDGILMENLALNFQHEVQWPEAKYFYANQNFMEAIHSETYSLLIDTYIADKKEKQHLLEGSTTIPAIKKKADWALQWLDAKNADFATRLIAFAAVEGIFFSGAFCSIFWLKKRGLMPGLTTSNEFIARDEGMHTDFACLLYGKIKHRLSKTKATKIIKDAVKIEKNFITKALPCELIGMNAVLMSQYIEFVADRILVQLGYPKVYDAANPFDFMERISLEGKDNFFEKRVTNYAKAAVGKTQEEMSFSMAADF